MIIYDEISYIEASLYVNELTKESDFNSIRTHLLRVFIYVEQNQQKYKCSWGEKKCQIQIKDL